MILEVLVLVPKPSLERDRTILCHSLHVFLTTLRKKVMNDTNKELFCSFPSCTWEREGELGQMHHVFWKVMTLNNTLSLKLKKIRRYIVWALFPFPRLPTPPNLVPFFLKLKTENRPHFVPTSTCSQSVL